jgi:hypothetical protein
VAGAILPNFHLFIQKEIVLELVLIVGENRESVEKKAKTGSY